MDKKRVLVADDDFVVRLALETLLRKIGLNVVLASDGQMAIGQVNTAGLPFDLVLTDYDLSTEETGIDVIKAAKARSKGTKAILMTGAEGILREDLMDRVPKVGGDGFLRKPFSRDLKELIELIQQVLGS